MEEQTNRKTAEEILEKNSTFHFRSKLSVDPKDTVWNICPRDALKAMEEYATQELTALSDNHTLLTEVIVSELNMRDKELQSLKERNSELEVEIQKWSDRALWLTNGEIPALIDKNKVLQSQLDKAVNILENIELLFRINASTTGFYEGFAFYDEKTNHEHINEFLTAYKEGK